ncbi:hypothetical protein AB0L00_15245 [Actinoallomurus sp. NPDC052308]|uniref:TlpA family protein disulfide reductase n=1 Tax=Actinoallomurus sp. NPDC052308 TaxID=3155530 RepID=UPI00343B51F2
MWESRDARREAHHFASVWGIEGTVLLDETGTYAARVGIRGVPTNVLVDERNIVRAVGVITPADLHAAVDRLLA